MEVEISDHHDELIRSLYDLRAQMLPLISWDERLIVEVAIQTLEYLKSYAADIPMREYLKLPPEEQAELNAKWAAERERAEAEPEPEGQLRWTGDDYMRLICVGGFELDDGRLVPRL